MSSVLIKGLKLPKHAAVNGEKDTVYKGVILAHPDNTAEPVIDSKFASAYDNGHDIQRYPLTEIPTPHGRLIDADNLKCPLSWQGEIVKATVREAPTIIEAEVSE